MIGVFMIIAFLLGALTESDTKISDELKTELETESCSLQVDRYFVDEEDFNFHLSSNGYAGWQMGCNYRFGSNADWNEEKQEYGNQEFLRCVNGITYKRTTYE